MDNLIIPGIVVALLGFVLKLTYKNSKNYFFGYRTPRSLKNQQNWNIANKISSSAIIWCGAGGILAGIMSYLFIEEKFRFEFIGIVILFGIIISIYRTEKILAKEDKE